MPGDVPSAGDLDGEGEFYDQREALAGDQTLSDGDQTLSDADQTLSDADQTSADSDQTASERDQLAADRDQRASDRDQAARPSGDPDADYLLSREHRARSAAERDLSVVARSDTARRRHELAEQRDAAAAQRDKLAAIRDEMAARLDAEDESADGQLAEGDGSTNLARLRQRAANNRRRAAEHRVAAARDRAHAAEDRQQAAIDRAAAEVEFLSQGTDHLTGALRRHVGLNAMQREWDRTERAQQAFVAAFVDVVGLKTTNSRHGHKAGDELLQAVTHCIRDRLRSYDLIARYGGDEFVVTLSGQTVADVSDRFDDIAAQLALEAEGARMTVGLAERRPGDTLDGLIGRADAAMRARRNRG